MSNIVAKIRQRIAKKELNKFDLSCNHITTNDFMRMSCSYIREMVPGSSINLKQSTFVRLAPMVKPMFGRCRLENRAFFVPMRTIMRGWNEFITDTVYDGQIPSVPTVSLNNLATALADTAFSTPTASTSGTVYDWKTGSGTGGTRYRFTVLGKQVWQILNGLGYKFPIGYWKSQSSSTADGQNVSALPLLAFCKIYDDWYKAQAYSDSTFYDLFDSVTGSGIDNSTKLIAVFKRIAKCVYDKDYFSSAWDRATTPNQGLNSTYSVTDVTNDSTGTNRAVVSNGSVASSAVPTSPSIKGTNTAGVPSGSIAPFNISQYAIKSLYRLTDYLKRHQIAGGLAMNRYLSRWGIQLDNAQTRRSVYLGKNTVEIQIADVMATANGQNGDDQNTTIGQYAGKGLGFNGGALKYKADEYGYIIIVSTIIPSVGYVQGLNRMILHTDRLSFFTPEFDSLGVQAIAKPELAYDFNGKDREDNFLANNTGITSEIFGFTSRYAEYKSDTDKLTGDFVIPSFDGTVSGASINDVWHLNRMFNLKTISGTGLTHSLDFVSATDSNQYDRIFAVTADENTLQTGRVDRFYTIHHFEVEMYQPMSKMFDDYEYEHDAGNKEVSVEVNGTQFN